MTVQPKAALNVEAPPFYAMLPVRAFKLCVKRLPRSVTTATIVAYFSRWGAVQKVFLADDCTVSGLTKFAIVHFSDYTEVEAAMAQLPHVIDGEVLATCRASLCPYCIFWRQTEKQQQLQLLQYQQQVKDVSVPVLVCCWARSYGLAKATAALFPNAPLGHYYLDQPLPEHSAGQSCDQGPICGETQPEEQSGIAEENSGPIGLTVASSQSIDQETVQQPRSAERSPEPVR
ncbi:unnamed protein product [Gongylonema pulchrum]|uniref:RRM domain-containing protein n=1 Tax=Gongylonema pulchrum TaxID=637853 RepID=A0A183DSZ9_9BILA|nr:unnamed protein product [Gongylonema pulchrum]